MTDATDKAMIVAQYTDCRAYRGLGIVRITCELPVEYESLVHRLIGYPQKAVIISVASEDVVKAFGEQLKRPVKEAPAREKPKQTPSQHCGTWCGNKKFQEWLGIDPSASKVYAEDLAACEVRDRLDIISRSELNTNPAAAERWYRLHTEFFYRDTPALEKQRSMEGTNDPH